MTDLIYPAIGSLVKIDYSTLLHSTCSDHGTINVVVTEDTYGVIVGYDPVPDQSLEVMVGTQYYVVHSKEMISHKVVSYWPLVVISELSQENC